MRTIIHTARIEAASGPMYLYWLPQQGGAEWVLEGNAGVVASHHHNYIEACEAMDGATEADEAIQLEIDALINGPGRRPIEGALMCGLMGSEARALAQQWMWF